MSEADQSTHKDIRSPLPPERMSFLSLPENTTIVAPFNGKFSIYVRKDPIKGITQTAFASLTTEDGNNAIYFDLGGGFNNVPTKSLIPETNTPNKPEGLFVWKQEGVEVKAGTPLFSLGQRKTSISFGVQPKTS